VPESTAKLLRLVSELAVRHPAVVAQVVLDVHLQQRCQGLARFSGQFGKKKFASFLSKYSIFTSILPEDNKKFRANISGKMSNNVRNQSKFGRRFFHKDKGLFREYRAYWADISASWQH
jgi:hypothetical protein